jgi:L-alanine-DL-glutamate epimerase-like enolase superfamily enzyme
VRIYTDEGLVGLGETFPATPAEKAILLNDLAPRLVGRDPGDIESIWHDNTGMAERDIDSAKRLNGATDDVPGSPWQRHNSVAFAHVP